MPSASRVHLVGSVPLAAPESVFHRLGTELGNHLKRVVDGETGRRASWIGFVQKLLNKNPAFEDDPNVPRFQFTQWDGKILREFNQLRLKADIDPDSVALQTGYADDAIHAYPIFKRLQANGIIPRNVKYQICCGTPLGVAYLFISPNALDDFQRIYTRHLLGEVAKIAAALPSESLCFQWDIAPEVFVWERHFDIDGEYYRQRISNSLAEIGDGIPTEIELGYHLCYGSPADEHIVQPKDLEVCVEMSNALLTRVGRPVDFIHVPVPKEREDDDYFRPLTELKLPTETDLYLGCVHRNDDTGNRARLSAAERYTTINGIGSECGWGRADPEALDAILAAHKALVREHTQTKRLVSF